MRREPALPAREQGLEQLGEVLGHVGEGGGQQLDHLGIDGPDDLAQLAPGAADVVELGWTGTSWRSSSAVSSSRARG